eukprot:364041-Chlamydomonas_euryale.AAC.2
MSRQAGRQATHQSACMQPLQRKEAGRQATIRAHAFKLDSESRQAGKQPKQPMEQADTRGADTKGAACTAGRS